MSALPHPSSAPHAPLELFEALIVEVIEPGRLSLRRPDVARVVEARVALVGYRPTAGDRVLCVANDRAAYVTGVLVAGETSPEPSPSGARATVEDGNIVVRAEDGVLLLSFDPVSGVTRVRSQTTVLSIEATEKLELKAPDVCVEAERFTSRVGDLVTEAHRVSTSADRWELRANRIVERAKNAFLDVDGMLQTRAGTLRSIAREGMSLFARRTSVRSEKDTSIDGQRVLLG
ncbi:MAG: DUF3540 domain-containing protein [Sandaracinaceae bacterium]|nr:DUF3540 domain-containing protein [Sandaracinaceae bacterium]